MENKINLLSIFLTVHDLKYYWKHVTFDKTLCVYVPGDLLKDFCSSLNASEFFRGLVMEPEDQYITQNGEVIFTHFERICEHHDIEPEEYFPITEDVTY